MKKIAVIFLILFSVPGMAQNKKSTTSQNNNLPVYIIDSVKTSAAYFKYIAPDNISSVNVLKNLQYPVGVIYITLKDHSEFTKLLQAPLLSLNDIAKTNIPEPERLKPILFILDDKLLTDTVAIRIPSICVHKVTIVRAAETAYFKTVLPDVLLMMVSTKPPVIMIRGIASNN
jgi:hypothetical protein